MTQKNALEKINPALTSNTILNGSLIKTSRGYLFMSVALGKAVVEDKTVIALSPQSPLGQKLMSLSINSTASVNNIDYTIESIE